VVVLPERAAGSALNLRPAQIWPLLDVYVVLQEMRQIGAYHESRNGLSLFNAIELVRTYVVVLIEAQVS
jgi:hypothetical protein